MAEKLLAILIFIVAFAILICIHEAGHLSMAKLFKVYCKEYSIGFGPAIYSRKKEGKETKFSIRCVPLGGYVSMFGEAEMAEEDPDFKDIPLERSLEGIKKWKKAIVVSAGVILNAVLAFVLIFLSNFACSSISPSRSLTVSENSILFEAGLRSDDRISFPTYGENKTRAFTYRYTGEKKEIFADTFYIVDNDVEHEGNHYVLAFYFTSNKKPTLTDGLKLYKTISREEVASSELNNQLYSEWIAYEDEKNTEKTQYFADISQGIYTFDKDTILNGVNLSFERNGEDKTVTFDLPINVTKKGNNFVNNFADSGLIFNTVKNKLSASEKWKYTCSDYKNASLAVFDGLGVLFTGGIRNMSGVVGILDFSTTTFQNYTMSYYLYFWGLISVNLAIFNLLPFPGLDGWQLLVTAIEGITRKKLPSKFKTIMSVIGLCLLFALMIVVLVLDISRLAGL